MKKAIKRDKRRATATADTMTTTVKPASAVLASEVLFPASVLILKMSAILATKGS